MPVYLMGSNPLHLNLIEGTLQAAGWRSEEIHHPTDVAALEAGLGRQPQAILVLDLGSGEDSTLPAWLGEITRRWSGLQVVLLSAQRGEALLLQAMRSGAREVLDSPPEPAELVQTLQRLKPQATEAASQDAPLAPVLAFIASKGGNGSTQLASNLAWLLATEFGRDTVLADLDLMYGDASFYLGGSQARHSIDHLAQQGARLDRQLLRSSLHPVHPRLHLLAAPAAPSLPRGIAPDALARVLTLARQHHQVLILDLPRQLDALTLQALQLADMAFIVLRQRVPDVRNAQRLIQVLQSNGLGQDRLRPLLNREGEAASLDANAIAKALPMPIAHRVANDPMALQGCVHLGLPLHEHAPGSPVLRDLRLLASQSLTLPMPQRPGWLGRWLGKPANPTPA
jgi:pilus assembly protein CpaE